MDRNSQNYSALKTPVPPGSKLPQIVVQMPVYKESLEEVRPRLYAMHAVRVLLQLARLLFYSRCDCVALWPNMSR
jgi:hypothetical protein